MNLSEIYQTEFILHMLNIITLKNLDNFMKSVNSDSGHPFGNKVSISFFK